MWKQDIETSVKLYNDWFMEFAPKTFRKSRKDSIDSVKNVLEITQNLSQINPEIIRNNPSALQVLRMCTAPPIARDRLIGLSGVQKSLVQTLESGNLPVQMSAGKLKLQLERISSVITELLDVDLFSLENESNDAGQSISKHSVDIAASIIGDRVSGATSDPKIRNAQEEFQLNKIKMYLEKKGYVEKTPQGSFPNSMESGTFCFRFNLKVGREEEIKLPIDAVIKPKSSSPESMPVLIEAKSAGDYTNTNKRRKEEATKNRQLKEKFGNETQLILFLRGYFDAGYLGYEAAEGLDWIWEHRIEDLDKLRI